MYAFLGLYDFYQTDYYELNRITPDFFFTHPDYDCSNQYYDIAIGVMETPTTFSGTKKIQLINFATCTRSAFLICNIHFENYYF